MTFKIIALIVIAILLVLDYAMLVVASRADRRAERMYRRWKSERGNSTPDKRPHQGQGRRVCAGLGKMPRLQTLGLQLQWL